MPSFFTQEFHGIAAGGLGKAVAAMVASGQLPPDQDLEDDISITSTIEEAYDSEEEFTVLRILAERSCQNHSYYLVEWEGWPLDEATWGPEEDFKDETLSEWEEIKKSTGRKTAVGFRVQDWKDALLESIRQRRDRHDRRNRKRISQGLMPTDFYDSRQHGLDTIEETMDEVMDPDDDQPPVEQSAACDDDGSSSSDDLTVLDTLRSSNQSRRQQTKPKQTTQDAARPRSKEVGAVSASSPKQKRASSDEAKSADAPQQRPVTKVSQPPAKLLKPSATAAKSDSAKSSGSLRKDTSSIHKKLLPARPLATQDMSASVLTRTAANRPTASVRSPEEIVNVFAGGKVRKPRKRLSEVVSDTTKEPQLLRLRLQNLAQKQLRDNEGTRAPSLQLPLRTNTPPSTRRSSAPDVSQSSVNVDREAEVQAPSTTRRSSLGSSLPTSSSVHEKQSVRKSVDSNDDQRPPKRARTVHFDIEPRAKDTEGYDEYESLFVEQDDSMPDVDQQVADPEPEQTEATSAPNSGPPTLPILSPVRKECRFGSGAAQSLGMNFVGVPAEETQASWAAHFRGENELIFSHSCMSRDFLDPVCPHGEELCRGYAEGVSMSEQLDGITNDIKIGALGLLCHLGEFYAILFSSRSEEWSQIQSRGCPKGDSVLGFVLFKSEPCLNPIMLAPFTYMTEKQSGSPAFSPEERIPTVDLVFRSTLSQLLPPVSQQAQETSFFLAFPPSAEQEAIFISQWLKSSTALCNVKSSLKPGDWSSFVDQNSGVVVIHEKAFSAIRSFPHLADMLHASKSNFLFWLFRRPLLSMERFPQMDPALRAISTELCPILRPGTAILVTPSFLVSQPRQAYNFFKWGFQNFSQTSQSYYPGKLVVCAGIEDYILGLAKEKAELCSKNRTAIKWDMEAYMKSWRLVRELMSESVEIADGRVVLAPDAIDGNDEQSLVNWFGWWSMEHIDQVRRFTVLGSSNQRHDRMTRLIRPGCFEHSIQCQKEAAHDDGRDQPQSFQLVYNDDGVAIGDFLMQVDEAARHMPFCPIAFHTSPVSYWHADMAWHFGDYTSKFHTYTVWFKKLTDFLAPRGKPEPKGRVNTFCGFFYTIEGAWDGHTHLGSGKSNSRRPWVAIFRPVDLHIKPWKSTELLLWDLKAHSKASADASLHVTDLIDAQQALVQMVKAQSRIHVLPLSRVWLGGIPAGDSADQNAHPLDITLDWLSKVRDNVRQRVPLPAAKLREQGWKQVQASEMSKGPPTQTLTRAEVEDMEMKDAGLTDDEVEVATKKTIFHPPSVPGKHPGARGSRNLLYAWAEAKLKAGERGKCEYTFQPTTQWYREQLQEGRGFRHIQVSSWEPVFERYAIDDPKKV